MMLFMYKNEVDSVPGSEEVPENIAVADDEVDSDVPGTDSNLAVGPEDRGLESEAFSEHGNVREKLTLFKFLVLPAAKVTVDIKAFFYSFSVVCLNY